VPSTRLITCSLSWVTRSGGRSRSADRVVTLGSALAGGVAVGLCEVAPLVEVGAAVAAPAPPTRPGRSQAVGADGDGGMFDDGASAGWAVCSSTTSSLMPARCPGPRCGPGRGRQRPPASIPTVMRSQAPPVGDHLVGRPAGPPGSRRSTLPISARRRAGDGLGTTSRIAHPRRSHVHRSGHVAGNGEVDRPSGCTLFYFEPPNETMISQPTLLFSSSFNTIVAHDRP